MGYWDVSIRLYHSNGSLLGTHSGYTWQIMDLALSFQDHTVTDQDDTTTDPNDTGEVSNVTGGEDQNGFLLFSSRSIFLRFMVFVILAIYRRSMR